MLNLFIYSFTSFYVSFIQLLDTTLESVYTLYFSDGAGRTGTYIAISNLLERMKIEQAMDVFQSIKIIRGTRPQFVENAVSNEGYYSKYVPLDIKMK
jgi:protein tyrosine phosphatase